MKNETTTPNPAPQTNPKTSPFSYTQLAFLINYIIGHRAPDLPTAEVRTAAYDGRLLRLLATRYGNIADFYSLIWKPATLQELEAGLADAARLLAWSERRAIGVSSSGLCLAMAIVLQAIQQQFHKSGPEQGRAEPVAPVPHRSGGLPAACESPRGATGSPVPSTQSCYKQMRAKEFLKGGVSHNGFCFALALVLVAIRQQFGAVPKQAPTVLSFENN